MTIWFTSDHHFGHQRIIELAGRPFETIETMNAELIRRWNEVVHDDDDIYYLGDFSLSFRHVHDVVSQLKGRKILFAGNHDECSPVKHVTPGKRIHWKMKYLEAGFHDIKFEEVMRFEPDGLEFRMTHFPYTPHDDRYPELLPIDDGKWLLHGHVHTRWQIKGRQINVGVDRWNYYPVSLHQIKELIGTTHATQLTPDPIKPD